MKLIAPTYYNKFHCIADRCKHTCSKGWEIDVDEEKLEQYLSEPEIAKHIDTTNTAHFILKEEERCPFLNEYNLCNLIINHGEEILCQICRDHPRFRNFRSDRVEIGLGLVCEEACRIILSEAEPMTLCVIEDDGEISPDDDDENALWEFRDKMLSEIIETGKKARLYEYLIYRYIPDALYDDRLDERVQFIKASYKELTDLWDKTDGTIDEIVNATVKWSYDVEYDEDELEKRIAPYTEI